jgi:hypothetical protein
MSKKGSMWGAEHFFVIEEDGENVKYLVRSRVSADLQVLLDIFRNGRPVKESLIVGYMAEKRKILIRKKVSAC